MIKVNVENMTASCINAKALCGCERILRKYENVTRMSVFGHECESILCDCESIWAIVRAFTVMASALSENSCAILRALYEREMFLCTSGMFKYIIYNII